MGVSKRRKVSHSRPYRKRRPRKYIKGRRDMIAPVPRMKKVTFKYTEEINLNPAAAGTAQYRFWANNLYDPNYEAGGH